MPKIKLHVYQYVCSHCGEVSETIVHQGSSYECGRCCKGHKRVMRVDKLTSLDQLIGIQ